MTGNCRHHSESMTSSESESIDVTNEIFPGFHKRTLPESSLQDDSSEDGENHQKKRFKTQKSSEELFIIDKIGEKNHTSERFEKRVLSTKDGFYPCEVCEAIFINFKIYQAHLHDKSHQRAFKKLKARIESERKEASPTPNGYIKASDEMHSSNPTVPHGIIRRRIRDDSMIQNIVENEFKACPGLEHVTEIRGLKETFYYCAICNITCGNEKILSHLRKAKHLLYSLKALCPEAYENMASMRKSKRRHYLYDILSKIQNKEGIGKIVVEKDYLDDYDSEKNNCLHIQETPSTSFDNQSMLCYQDPTYSKRNYFCHKCECSMFDIKMWESHTNRRAQNKLSKTAIASKMNIAPLQKSEAFLVDRLQDLDEPAVGLDYIREFQHYEEKKETYHCFLCADCLTCLSIVNHVTSFSHRKKFLEHIGHYSIDQVRNLDPETTKSYYILGEICRTVKKEIGMGCPEVFNLTS